jgi:hypothetical protein
VGNRVYGGRISVFPTTVKRKDTHHPLNGVPLGFMIVAPSSENWLQDFEK